MTQAKKSIYFLFLWLMCCITANVYGQYETATNGSFNTIRTQIPVSPEMALYQKYGDIPVDYSTGVANINIPIAEIKLKGFSWPVNMSYHGGGNKVNEFASVVGLGWVLNAGGYISSSENLSNGFMEIRRSLNLNKLRYPYFGVCGDTDLIYENQDDVSQASVIAASGWLYKPVISYLSTPVMNLKFYDEYTIPISNNRIEYSSSEGIKVTDASGNQYFFKIGGQKLTFTNCNIASTDVSTSVALTKVITYTGETIDFNYEEVNYTYSDPNYETKQRTDILDCLRCQTDVIPDNKNCPVNNTVTEFVLKSIVASNGQKVSFHYGSRNDHPNNKKLEAILVQEISDGLYVNKAWYTLGYSYFENVLENGKQLKLDNVKNIINSNNQEVYTFDYYMDAQLPDRLSKSVDYNGYYNGVLNASTIPSLSNRTPVLYYAKAGVLTKITYPTGGSSAFSYDFSSWGGLKIIQILDYTAPGVLARKKTYDYGADGFNFNYEFTNTDYRYFFGHGDNGTVISSAPVGNLQLVTCRVYTEQSTPVSSFMSGFTDPPKYYATVTEYVDDYVNNVIGEVGKTIYKYNSYPYLNLRGRNAALASFGVKLTEKEIYKGISNELLYKEENYYSVAEDDPFRPGYDFYGEALNPRDKRLFIKQLELTRDEMSHSLSDAGISGFKCYGKEFFQRDFQLDFPVIYLDKQITRSYESGQELYTEKVYTYDKLAGEIEPNMITTSSSDGDVVKQHIKYTTSNLAGLGYTAQETNANAKLLSDNIITPLWKQNSKGTEITSESQVYYSEINNKALATKEKLSFGSLDYISMQVSKYDIHHNAVEVLEREKKYSAYRFSNKNELTAKFANSTFAETGYASFDNGGDTGFGFNSSGLAYGVSYSGKVGFNLSNSSISKSGLQSGKKYIISAYIKTGSVTLSGASLANPDYTLIADGWSLYYTTFVPTSNQITITGSGYIDDLKIYPADGEITSFVYTDFYQQLAAQADSRSNTIFFDYQPDGKLWSITDQKGNIIKQYCYNISGQTVDCNVKPSIEIPKFYVSLSIGDPVVTYDNGLSSPDMSTRADIFIKLYLDAERTIPYIPTSNKIIAIEETIVSDLGYGPVTNTSTIYRTVAAGTSEYFMGNILINRVFEVIDPNNPWMSVLTTTDLSYQVKSILGADYIVL